MSRETKQKVKSKRKKKGRLNKFGYSNQSRNIGTAKKIDSCIDKEKEVMILISAYSTIP